MTTTTASLEQLDQASWAGGVVSFPEMGSLKELAANVLDGPITRSSMYRVSKRIFDVLLALGLLILLSPLMLLVALAVKLTSRGPVLFKQTRAGLDGKPFTMLKFRSMKVGAEDDRQFLADRNEKDGPVFKIANDPRLTRLGKFLRKMSIDELPQLLNVLVGQMSIVGPRPLWWPEAQETRGNARIRMCVKPGLTCIWQISGRSELSYEQWVQLDLFYIKTRSFLLDILIVVQTIPVVITGYGAY